MKNGSLVVEYSLVPKRRGRKAAEKPAVITTGKLHARITRLMALAIKLDEV